MRTRLQIAATILQRPIWRDLDPRQLMTCAFARVQQCLSEGGEVPVGDWTLEVDPGSADHPLPSAINPSRLDPNAPFPVPVRGVG